MLIQITVAGKDLKEVNQLLDPNNLNKPQESLCFELMQSSLRIVPNPITILVTYDEWVTLSDYQDEHE